uniref:MARVEL domain-containing protein n=1 Tax=Mesocestoides corti TaxID=53468 RepID=A0A5K3FG84_MESCO
MIPLRNETRSPNSSSVFLRRIGSLSFSSNLLATLLLCGALVLKATFTIREAPCQLNSIGFQDIFSYYLTSGDEERKEFIGALNRCVTPDSVIVLYCCLALIIMSFMCSIFQLLANLNLNFSFMRKCQKRGALDICSILLNCVCLGLMYWAASLISQFQFKQLRIMIVIPTFSSIEETRHFINNATKKIDAFSVSFSGAFYFVLLAGLSSLVSFATQNCNGANISLWRQTTGRVEPQRTVN